MTVNAGRFTALAAVAPGASVEVRPHASTTVATLYATRSGTTEVTNPVVANQRGDFGFFAEYGDYDLVIDQGGVDGQGGVDVTVSVTVRPDPQNAWPG